MYTFPSATINNMTFTAKRWGQFPTITYDTSNAAVTAGHEIVVVAADLSNVKIYIKSGGSTNAQIAAAIAASTATVESLAAKDLVSTSIVSGHTTDTNTSAGPTSLSGASSVPPPAEPSVPSAGIDKLAADPVNPTEGQIWYNTASHVFKYYDGTAVKTVATV